MMNNKSLSALVDQVRGVSYKPKDIHDTLNDLSIVLLRANNIFDGSVDFSDVIYIDRKRVSPSQILRRGDILVCASSGSKDLVGKAASFNCDGEYTFGAFCKVVRPKNVDDADYISMFFQSPKYRREIAASALGANINNIRNEHIDNLIINWPVKLNRDIIVSLLNQSKSIITLRKKQLQLFDELIKARFVEMFGDPVNNSKGWNNQVLKSVCIKITDGEHGSVERVKEGHPFLNAKHIKSTGDIDWANVTYTPDEVHERIYKRCNPESGDVMMTTTGTIGNVAVVPCGREPFTMDRGITLLKLDSTKVQPLYIAWLLRHQSIQAIMNSKIHASAIGHLFLNKVEKIPVIVPDMESQNAFSNFVAQIDKSKVMKRLRLAHFLFVDR